MKLLVFVCFIIAHFTTTSSSSLSSSDCQGGMRTCRIGNQPISYDSCTDFCCGENVVEREPYSECCGNENDGLPYNARSQKCCFWNNTAVIHLTNETSLECCGLELFNRDDLPTVICCNGIKEEPRPFDYLTEMCCDGVVNFAGTTAYTQCCGETAYDRRNSSCPCQNNVVYLGIPDHLAGCCYSPDREIRNGYNILTQSCCGPNAYEETTEFCCGDSVGNQATQICCGGSRITPIDAELTGDRIGCCLLNSGIYATYNTLISACCGGEVLALDTNITQICCGGILVNAAEDGNLCCRGVPYFPETSVCCPNALGAGDRCCNGVPYQSDGQLVCCNNEIVDGNRCCNGIGFFDDGTQICCQGMLRNSTNFTIPACCVFEAFDSFVQTCCGVTIYNNPVFFDGESHTTRCCGNFGSLDSLRPYDYLRQLCCDETIVNLDGVPAERASCCGQSFIDESDELCCNNNVFINLYDDLGECCGDDVINTDTTICCGGIPRNRTDFFCCGDVSVPLGPILFDNAACCGDGLIDDTLQLCCGGEARILDGIDPSYAMCCGSGVIDSRTTLCCNGVPQDRNDADGIVCCGTSAIDPSVNKCCDGVPRPLGNIPPERAICCGDRCINGDTFWCCNGQQYSKGSVEGENIESLTCDDVLPTE